MLVKLGFSFKLWCLDLFLGETEVQRCGATFSLPRMARHARRRGHMQVSKGHCGFGKRPRPTSLPWLMTINEVDELEATMEESSLSNHFHGYSEKDLQHVSPTSASQHSGTSQSKLDLPRTEQLTRTFPRLHLRHQHEGAASCEINGVRRLWQVQTRWANAAVSNAFKQICCSSLGCDSSTSRKY